MHAIRCFRERPGSAGTARLGISLLLLLLALLSLPRQAAALQLPASWRISQGAAAPWRGGQLQPVATARLRGATVRFAASRVEGPAPLGCDGARYEYVAVPAEGLFQGALPDAGAARALGIAQLPVLTLRVDCEGGSFDYHLAGPDRMLIALDNVIWTLVATSRASGPQAAVHQLLAEHLTHDMSFSLERVQPKRRYLAPELGALITAYFAQDVLQDEPPPISGDPFTDSQEYPSRFAYGATEVNGAVARVPVIFRDQGSTRIVVFSLRRLGGEWLVEDLLYEDGSTFRQLLTAR